MPPIINSQNLFQNAQFQQFVDFAEAAAKAAEEAAKDDPNRAIEVPWEAISAGMESSRPTVSSESNTNKLLLDPEQFRVK